MRILPTLLGLAVFCASAGAVEPTGDSGVTIRFDVEGGQYERLPVDAYSPPTAESGPFEVRFVITGINRHWKWNSQIAFFFQHAESANGVKTDALEEAAPSRSRLEALRLRILRDRRAPDFFAELRVKRGKGGTEETIKMIRKPIDLNEIVTVSVMEHREGRLLLAINGKTVPISFGDYLDRLDVIVSGVEGSVWMPVK